MKKLSIIVRSEKLDDVKAILDECGSTGATVSNIMGYGNQKGYKTTYRGSEYVVNLIPKIKIETIVKDDVADNIIFKVCEKISTGKVGDGKIFVYDVADVIRIRTGEHGDTALYHLPVIQINPLCYTTPVITQNTFVLVLEQRYIKLQKTQLKYRPRTRFAS